MRVYKMSGDCGDLIYALPVVRYYGGGIVAIAQATLGKKSNGEPSGFGPNAFRLFKPLLLAQDYIKDVIEWDGRACVDLDAFRSGPGRNRLGCDNLAHLILTAHQVPKRELHFPWLKVPKVDVGIERVFARSPRYQNIRAVKNVRKLLTPNSVFVGLQSEWQSFCREVGKIEYLPVADFYEMAAAINSASDCFVGNQSFPLALAIALGQNYVCEQSLKSPNCVFVRGEYLK